MKPFRHGCGGHCGGARRCPAAVPRPDNLGKASEYIATRADGCARTRSELRSLKDALFRYEQRWGAL